MKKTNKELASEISGMKETETMLSEKISGLESEKKILNEKVSQLLSEISDRERKISSLEDNNEKLSHEITNTSLKLSEELNRKAFQDNKKNVDDSNPSQIEVGMTVTPKENVSGFEKGYNAFVNAVDGDDMVITNKDNPKMHRNETKVKTNAFRIVATLIFMFMLSFIASAQIDSVGAGDLSSTTEGLVSAIFGVLDYFGISISPWRTIIMGVILFIVRRIEKGIVKKKAAEKVSEVIIEDLNDRSTPNLSEHHKGLLRRVIDKIKGKK